MDDAQRDTLARVIDPEAWALYDDPRVQKRGNKLSDSIVQESRSVAVRIMESGLMASHEWDSREYLNAKRRIIEHTSRRGVCYSVEDGLDGYFMHDPRCPNWPDGAVGGSRCVK